jgi:hypothetical protein
MTGRLDLHRLHLPKGDWCSYQRFRAAPRALWRTDERVSPPLPQGTYCIFTSSTSVVMTLVMYLILPPRYDPLGYGNLDIGSIGILSMLSFSARGCPTFSVTAVRARQRASKILDGQRWHCMKAHESDENLKTLHSVSRGKATESNR